VGARAVVPALLGYAAALAAAFVLAAEVATGDGLWTVRVDNDARRLHVVDRATGRVARSMPVADRRGTTSRVARLLDAPPRRSVIVLLADIPEAWELSYDPHAEPVYEGLVHDYRGREAIANPGPLPVRRLHLDEPLTDVLFAPDHVHLVGAARGGALHVVNLHVRRRIETVRTDGDPRPERGAAAVRNGGVVYAIPDARRPLVYEIDGRTWRLRTHALPAPAERIEVGGDGAMAAVAGQTRAPLPRD
jgi:hypothetical protein